MKVATMTRSTVLTVLLLGGAIFGSAFAYDSGTRATRKKDIVDTAIAAGQFQTLVTAVKAAGLVETLKGEGPFTVFAPNDAAFGKLPAGTLEELLKPENKVKLQGILTYHVVPGRVTAKDVMKLQSAKTANGQTLTIRIENDVVMVDQAKVVKTDILTSNGLIHVIDTVVMPQEN